MKEEKDDGTWNQTSLVYNLPFASCGIFSKLLNLSKSSFLNFLNGNNATYFMRVKQNSKVAPEMYLA